MKQSLIELIKVAQNTNGQALLALVEKFKPLTFKLCGFLAYEDACQDLECELINLLLKLSIERFGELGDAAVLSYIKKSMYHYYIFLSKRQNQFQKSCPFSCLNEQETRMVENISSPVDSTITNQELIDDLRKCLSSRELEVIYQHYFLLMSIQEIAQNYSCSRQSVNQSKKRA